MKDKLTVLWTNADPITSELMVFMYTKNALIRGWWKEIDLVVWGATAKLLAENKEIQKSIMDVKDSGVNIRICMACASELNVVKDIEALGFELEYMGEPLTEALKGEGKVLSV